MGGGGKAESTPWRGPAGEARHTGATILLWETRGQSPWRSRLSGNGGVQPPSAATRQKQRHPCTARRSRAVWRQAKSGQGCCPEGAAPPVTANACPPPGRQGQRRECQRVSPKTPHPQGAQREECDPRKSRSFSHTPDRHPNGPGLKARSAPADRAGRPKGSASQQYERKPTSSALFTCECE